MAMILEIITIHLNKENVVRLKEYKDYKANEIIDDRSSLYPPPKTYSKPETIDVVLSPLELQPIKTEHESVYAYKVTHEIKWGSNGRDRRVLMSQGRGWESSASISNGIVWLTYREIGILTANKDPNYFFNLFGEAEKNDK